MNTEKTDIIYQNFQFFDDDKLNEIAKNNIKYTLESRLSAVKILKERNVNSKYISEVEQEFSDVQKINENKARSQKIEDKKILNFLKITNGNRMYEFKLERGNYLQITKITNKYFQIRIEGFRTIFSPVVIAKIDQNNIIYFPFFYCLPLFFTVIVTILLVVYSYYDDGYVSDSIIKILLILWIFNLIIQIIMMPFKKKLIIDIFKNKVLNKNPVS